MIIVVACCPCKKAITTTNSQTNDSTHIEENTEIKDSLSFTKPAVATVTVFVKCPDVKPVTEKVNNAVSTFEIKNGIAKANCYCDSLAVISRYTKKTKNAFKSHLNVVKEVKVVPMPYIPLWVKIMAGMGALSALYCIYKLIKFFK